MEEAGGARSHANANCHAGSVGRVRTLSLRELNRATLARQLLLDLAGNLLPAREPALSELGRSLLFTVHPKKVAERVAEAIQNVVEAEVCMFVAELENIGLISCAYNAFHSDGLSVAVLSENPFPGTSGKMLAARSWAL